MFNRSAAALFLLLGGITAKAQTDTVMHSQLDSTSITASVNSSPIRGSLTSTLTASTRGLQKLPMILGNADPLRYASMFPGVQTSAEYDSGVHILGCETGHNDISLAGVPIYGAGHLLGFFSVFNPSHHEQMSLSLNRADASRLGGSLRMELPGSLPSQASGELSIGLMSSQGTLRMPTGRRSGLAVSARRSYLDTFYRNLLVLENSSISYGFGDYNLTWMLDSGAADRIWVDLYMGNDRAIMHETNFNADFSTLWGNRSAALHWQHGPLMQSLYASGYECTADVQQELVHAAVPSSISTYGYRADWKGNGCSVQLDAAWHDILPQCPSCEGSFNFINTQERQTALESSAEFTLQHSWALDWTAEASIRGHMYLSPEREWMPALSPRLMLGYDSHRWGRLGLCAGTAHQYLIRTGISDVGLPVEFWFAAGRHAGPQSSRYAILSYDLSLMDEGIQLSAQAYWKHLANQVEYNGVILDFLNSAYTLDQSILKGHGRNYGITLMASKRSGALTGWVSYALGRALRQFDDPWLQDEYPSDHERLHEFNAVASYHLDRWDLGGTMVAASGTPFTAPEYIYITSGYLISHYAAHNANRLPAYVRLDLSATFHCLDGAHWKRGNGRQRQALDVNFSLYNALGRKNALFYRVMFYDDTFYYNPVWFFLQWVPSVSVHYKF